VYTLRVHALMDYWKKAKEEKWGPRKEGGLKDN
jgi:hypothetical protein